MSRKDVAPGGRIRPPLKLRPIALPVEHGGWSFLLEPMLLALLVAGSWGGVLAAIASTGIFLLHQPLKMALKDRFKGRRLRRSVVAEYFVLGYGAIAAVPALFLLWLYPPLFLLPVLFAVPFACLQVYFDVRNQSRALIPELSGAVALSMTAPAIALLGGWSWMSVIIIWFLVVARVLTSVIYVRTRLRVMRGMPARRGFTLAAHAAVLGVVSWLAVSGNAPWLSVFVFAVLGGRAVFELSAFSCLGSAKAVGFSEVGYGLLTVISLALGFHFAL